MPYKVRDGYVIGPGGKRKNKKRLPHKKALAYMRALYANMPPSEKRKKRKK